jgi:hypothetical protein
LLLLDKVNTALSKLKKQEQISCLNVLIVLISAKKQMKSEVKQMEDEFSVKQKNTDPDESAQTVELQPLILKQTSHNTKGTQARPYDFGAETYDVYSNLKNPFMVGILAADTERIQLDPIKTQNLFQQIEKDSTYSLEYPLNISAHRKRKLSSTQQLSSTGENKTVTVGGDKLKTASMEYLPPEKLKEDKRKLEVYIQSFFSHFLKRLGEEPGGLPVIINELVPLFVEHQIRIRFYEAFRQIHAMDELITTLEKISSDNELENFELFCSAIFVFYSSQSNR